MRLPVAALALGLCLLSTACANSTDPIAAAPAAPDSPMVASTSEPAPDPAGPAASATPSAKPVKPAKPSTKPAAPSSSPAPQRTSAKPTAAKYDAEAACDAAYKSEDALIKVLEKHGMIAVGDDASPAQVAAAVTALKKEYRANARTVGHIRDLTADSEIKAALTRLITSRRVVLTKLSSAGTDVRKKNAALSTPAELAATTNVWGYPDGVCFNR